MAEVAHISVGLHNVNPLNTALTYPMGGSPHVFPVTTEANGLIPWHEPGTISLLHLYVPTNTRSTGVTVTSYINGVAGTLSVTVPATTTGEFEDDENSDAIADGDTAAYRLTRTTATAGTSLDIRTMSVVFEADTNTVTRHLFYLSGTPITVTATRYTGIAGYGGTSTVPSSDETDSYVLVLSDTTYRNAAVRVRSNTADGSQVLTFRKNTAGTAISMTIPASTSGLFEDTSDDVTATVGDLVAWEKAAGGTSGATTYEWMAIDAVTADNTWTRNSQGSTSGNGTTVASGVTRYLQLGGQCAAQASEADAQSHARVEQTITKLAIKVNVWNGTGTATITLRVNGNDTGITHTLTAGSTPKNWYVATGSVSVGLTDLLSVEVVNSGSQSLTIYQVQALFEGSVPITRVTQLVVLTMAADRATCPTPDEGEDLCEAVDDPLMFASWDSGVGDKDRFAQCALDFDSSYYGGWHDDKLIALSDVRRALSGPTGEYEVGTFSVDFADDDYYIRNKLSTGASRYYTKREIEVFYITPDGIAAQSVAKKIAAGVVDADPSFDDVTDLSVRFTCRDRVGAAMGWTQTGQSRVPRRVLNTINLPGCITSALALAAPIPYGTLSSNIAASGTLTPPIHDVAASHCGFFVETVFPNAGFGNWNNPPTPPTGVSLAVVAGGELSPDVSSGSGDYYVQVFPCDPVTGNVGDPFPFCDFDLSATVTPGNQQIDVTWSGSSASRFYVVLGTYYFGVRAQQYLVVDGTSCSFTRGPAFGEPGTQDSITPGARLMSDAAITYYHVRARNGSQVSELSPSQSFQSVNAIRFDNNRYRPVRVWWQSTGAPEYEVLSAGPGGPITETAYQWRWIVPSSSYDAVAGLHYFDNDFLYTTAIPAGAPEPRPQGKLKPIYTRNVVLNDIDTWREFLIAGCAIQGVDDWYYDPQDNVVGSVEISEDDGTTWLVPKTGTAWDNYFNTYYRDILGIDGITRRYTFCYGRGTKADLVASGNSLFTLNVRGVETNGDGTGTLLTDLHDQFVHLLENVILASGEGYTSGAWSLGATLGEDSICVVDRPAFESLKALRAEEFAGGIVGAGIVGANGRQVTVSEEMKRWQVCGDFRTGPNRFWQVTGQAINEALSVGDTTPLLDEFDIHVKSFKPRPRLAELANVLPYRYARNFVSDEWVVDNQTYTNDASISAWSERRELQGGLEFYYLDDALTVQYVLGLHARRRADVPTYVDLEGALCLLEAPFDVGRYVKLTHWRGVQLSGYRGRPLWILSSTLLPAVKRVRLECLDVSSLVPSGVSG